MIHRTIDLAADDRLRPIAEAEKAELRKELLERLDSPETEDDIAGRPIEEMIREICRDLGVEHDWIRNRGRRRTPADIEALCDRAAEPPITARPWPDNARDTVPEGATPLHHSARFRGS